MVALVHTWKRELWNVMMEYVVSIYFTSNDLIRDSSETLNNKPLAIINEPMSLPSKGASYGVVRAVCVSEIVLLYDIIYRHSDPGSNESPRHQIYLGA